eukprot:8787236-Pyramimonas_sp.AAC.1
MESPGVISDASWAILRQFGGLLFRLGPSGSSFEANAKHRVFFNEIIDFVFVGLLGGPIGGLLGRLR